LKHVLTKEKWHKIRAKLEHSVHKSARHFMQNVRVSKSVAQTVTELLKWNPF
jgi:hypothetical protein